MLLLILCKVWSSTSSSYFPSHPWIIIHWKLVFNSLTQYFQSLILNIEESFSNDTVFSPPFHQRKFAKSISRSRSRSHCRREGDLLSSVMQISKRERRREREKKEKLSTERRHSSSRHGRGSTCDTSCFFSRESRSRNLHALIRQVLSLFSHVPPWFSLHSWPKRGAPWKFFSFFFFLFPVESRRAFSFPSLLPFLFSRLRPCKEVWESLRVC